MSDVTVPYLQPPAVIVNEALSSIGQGGQYIGDITDGTPVAEAARYTYGRALRQLLRTAWWDFARARTQLTLLGDATLQNLNVSPIVEPPWSYAYAWPIDAVQGRWLPWTPVNVTPTENGIPLTTGGSAPVYYPQTPGRFLVSSSNQYPLVTGTVPWAQLPDLQRTEGVGPVYRKVILTDCCNACFVYTRLVTVIEEWDDLFREALVTMMALRLIPVAIQDPKLRVEERDKKSLALKMAVADARAASANEAGFPQSVDHQPNWITARNGGWNYGFSGPGGNIYSGYTYYPFDSSFQWGGSVY